MFRRLGHAEPTVKITVNGRDLNASHGDTVAAALLMHGITTFRISPVGGEPRGLYCGMGVCFDCLVTINGAGNRQACMAQVEEGMVIETGTGRRDLGKEGGR